MLRKAARPVDFGVPLNAPSTFNAYQGHRGERALLQLWDFAGRGVLLILVLYFFDVLEVFVHVCGRDDPPRACMPASSFNRFVLLTAVSVGAMILICKLPLTLRVLQIAWPWLLIFVWFWATTTWAAYPELSRTRVIAFALSYMAALGLAVGFRSPHSLTAAFLAGFAIVIVADLVSLAFPDSHTDIGVRGIHNHKNTAGLVASVAVVALAFGLPQLRFFALRCVAAGLAFSCVIFLYLTQSKTSLGLVFTALCLMPLYGLWVRRESARISHFIMTVFVCTLMFAAGASGTMLSRTSELLFGDATLTQRTAIWTVVEGSIAESPWRGHGFGSVWDVGSESNPFSEDDDAFYNDAKVFNEAHNGYLDLLLHGGRVALVLGWFLTLRALWFSLVLATNRAVPVRRRWGYCMLHCMIAILLVHNMTESSIFFPSSHMGYFFLVVLAQIERWKAEFDVYREAWRQAERRAPPAGGGP
jgi:exopolysaccharide production protein ExoQ